ncbi:MAG: hypothetical protein WBB22_14290 [Anaerolineae bacterium]
MISRDDSVLVVIDVQEKLMPVIANREKVIDDAVRLIKPRKSLVSLSF